MASSQTNNYQFHPFSPPPPSDPDNNPRVIVLVIVFVSLGAIFFLAFLAFSLCCLIKRRKKKSTVQETNIIHVDEDRKVREAIVPGPHGPTAVILSIEDDVHIDEEIRKNEKFGQGLHAKPSPSDDQGIHEIGTTSSGSITDHHQLEHKP
ncbi:proline-rich receptor-like protein kinase PERK10 [Quillaja saponaria]|uniref:Proline-rich receptor-like protein kinase PERK10 n=1 Tax=Quillaja saponaria TaxID=32244 RepID=A0AAD7LJD7_QUISA|nr:proline-rich receptor-like protein kinase PERK10 [Quillaja saponaria]